MGIAYDENDDGFAFSRTRSRKPKANPPQAPEPVQPETKPAPSRRKKNSISAPEPVQNEEQPKRRRSARLSGDKELITEPPAPKALPKRSKKATAAETKLPSDHDDNIEMIGVVATPKANGLHVQKKRDGGATKIALPFADTPIIRRNKEMRKGSGQGHRRSSTGIRGRRASSLIDSGASNGMGNSPHHTIHRYIFTMHYPHNPAIKRIRKAFQAA